MNRLRLLSLVVGCGVLLTGCDGGPKVVRGQVQGKVTLDGAALSPASVVFDNAAAGISISADTQADGSYVVKTHDTVGVPPGEYRIAVRPPAAGRESVETLMTPTADNSPIPQEYRDFATSGLTFTVAEGSNTFDIGLKSTAK